MTLPRCLLHRWIMRKVREKRDKRNGHIWKHKTNKEKGSVDIPPHLQPSPLKNGHKFVTNSNIWILPFPTKDILFSFRMSLLRKSDLFPNGNINDTVAKVTVPTAGKHMNRIDAKLFVNHRIAKCIGRSNISLNLWDFLKGICHLWLKQWFAAFQTSNAIWWNG